MRVCLVTEEEEGWGGIGTYTMALARGLYELGHRVHVIQRGWEQDDQITDGGLSVHHVVVSEPSWRRGTEWLTSRLYATRDALVWNRRVARRVRQIAAAEGLDVVEAPEYHGAGLALSLRRRALPLVVRLHSPAFLIADHNEERERRRPDALGVEAIERTALRRADLISTPSRAVAHAVAGRRRLAGTRLRVIPNPVDDRLFAPPRTPVEPGGRPTVMCVARLERVKGVDILVDALARVHERQPAVRLMILGDDDARGYRGASMGEHLRERARALGLPDSALELCGAVPHEQLAQILPSAGLCVVPSRWENFPYAALEAMSCGRAVVASATGGLPELITHGVDGLLVPTANVEALASAMLRLIEDRGLADRLGAAARETVQSRFTQRRVAEATASAYAELAARS